MTHANHPPAGPIHLASGDHLVPARQPEVVKHVRQGLKTGTFRDDTDCPLRASLLQWSVGVDVQLTDDTCECLERQALPTPDMDS